MTNTQKYYLQLINCKKCGLDHENAIENLKNKLKSSGGHTHVPEYYLQLNNCKKCRFDPHKGKIKNKKLIFYERDKSIYFNKILNL